MNFDNRLWQASFGTQTDLKDWVADVSTWRKNQRDTWLVFSDEIPLWVKIGMLKTVFASWGTKTDAQAKKDRNERNAKRGKASQKLEDADGARDGAGTDRKMDSQGMSQRRGAERSGEKCRVTFEARQAISGLFSGDPEKIKGHILPSAIVLRGRWANLQNIEWQSLPPDYWWLLTLVPAISL